MSKNAKSIIKTYKPASKMPISERAKQFMPFAALKGFEEAIALKEREYFKEERSELSEEMLEELSQKISALRENTPVAIEYYDGYIYRKVETVFMYYDISYRYIMTDFGKIFAEDIRNIVIL